VAAPLVSVLVRVSAGDEVGLARSLAALRGWRARRWEAVPAATWPDALARARGDLVVLLSAGERLVPATLGRIAALLAREPDAELCYADDVGLLRPAWSPEYLLTALYVDRAFVVRRGALEAVGGLRAEFDPVPEWDLVLRLAERRAFLHVPAVLLERRSEAWRAVDDPALVDAGRRAVEAACRRRGLDAAVEALPTPGTHRVRRKVRAGVSASIVVPFRDGAALLERCVASIRGSGAHEIVLVDNGSVEASTASLLRRLRDEPAVKLVAAPGPFNFSRLVNLGVAESRGDVVCLLNNDVEARDAGWLEALVEHALCPEVGAAGAKLLYPDGSVQHAGVVFGGPAGPDHVLRFAPGDDPGPGAMAGVVREVSAVTAACLAVRRQVFTSLGGFDEALPVAYNDLDFCLRARARGLAVLHVPHATLLHHEGAARGRDDAATAALAAMRARWGAAFERDAYTRLSEVAPPGWLVRQGRRLRWLAGDLAEAWRGVGESRRALVRPPPPAGLALIGGEPVARRGHANRYRLRLVNVGPGPAAVRVEVQGRLQLPEGERRFRAATEEVLAPSSALELTCETDWTDRFVLVRGLPWAPAGAAGAVCGRCELVAIARVGGASESLRIAQAVGA
jgi:GT2 family glycosyltransferase